MATKLIAIELIDTVNFTVFKQGYSGDALNQKMIDDALDIDDLKLETKHSACFAAGTLVHTDKGLVPIEQIKAEDLVLSQPEWGGKISYKPVVNTFRSLEKKEVYLLRYIDNYVAPSEDDPFSQSMNLPNMLPSKIHVEILTLNHPIWINDDIDNECDAGWQLALNMRGGEKVIFKDGSIGGVLAVNSLMKTNVDNIFYLATDGDFVPMVVDMRDNKLDIYYIAHLVLPAYNNSFNKDDHFPLADYILIGDIEKHVFLKDVIKYINSPMQEMASVDVFNIEVAENHTYYVGENGLWVHNTNDGSVALRNFI